MNPIRALIGRLTRELPTVEAEPEMGADLVLTCPDLPDREIVVWLDRPGEYLPFRYVASSGDVGNDSHGIMDETGIVETARKHFEID